MPPHYQDDSVTLHHGDCLDVLRELPDNSVDAVITDPPYGIAFMGKAWDQPGEFGSQRKNGTLNFQRWCTAWASECLRILKPGGHVLAFGGSRTWHRLASGIEDAGFELRDSIAWLYGSGFPKSLDVSKAIDKAAGAEREIVGINPRAAQQTAKQDDTTLGRYNGTSELLTAPATDAAKRWQGWGTALKPAFEPIVVARKSLAGTVAANVLEHGTGALNIDACRISTGDKLGGGSTTRGQQMKDGWHRPWMDDPGVVAANAERSRASVARSEELGRWPTNVVLDEDQAEVLDRQSGVTRDGVAVQRHGGGQQIFGHGDGMTRPDQGYGGEGGASRFFPVFNGRDGEASAEQRYTDNGGTSFSLKPGARKDAVAGPSAYFPTFRYEAKAPTSERPNADGVQHPTVKPLELMRWLVRLVTPVGAVVLEPFAGSGTTAEACVLEDRRCIAIEREAEYLPLIVSRLRKPVQQGLFGLEAGA